MLRASCHTLCERMAKINHSRPTACPIKSSIPEEGSGSTQSTSSSLSYTTYMYQNNHHESCYEHSMLVQVSHLNWAQKASRVPSAACKTPTCDRMVTINHGPSVTFLSTTVKPELGSWKAPRRPPRALNPLTCAGMDIMNHVRLTQSLPFLFFHLL
jgi:hypothetical protein